MNKYIKLNEIVPYLLQLAGVPDRFVNSQEEIALIEEAQAQNLEAMRQQQIGEGLAINKIMEEDKANAVK